MAMFRGTAPAAAAPAAAAYPACPRRCCQPAPSIKTGSKTSLITKPKSVGGGGGKGRKRRKSRAGGRKEKQNEIERRFLPVDFHSFYRLFVAARDGIGALGGGCDCRGGRGMQLYNGARSYSREICCNIRNLNWKYAAGAACLRKCCLCLCRCLSTCV